jgi:hypothetical protein
MLAMATKRSVLITDDIDGSGNAETVIFGIDGVSCEIDLAKKNRAKFDRALAPFVEHGRRVSSRSRRRASGRSGRSAAETSAIRAWAKSAGLKVSERGRISADVMRQYEADH